MKEDFLLRHDGAEQCENVPDPELVEEKGNACVGDGDALEHGGLNHLTICGAEAEPHLQQSRKLILD